MQDCFNTLKELHIDNQKYSIYSIESLKPKYNIDRLPFSIKIILENLLRNHDDRSVCKKDIESVLNWDPNKAPDIEIAFTPSRVILQDFTGVPAIADLAAMRDAMTQLNADPKKINPKSPVELVIDHSVMVDYFGTRAALNKNTEIEFERNKERYSFLKWGQQNLNNFKVVPPGTGIVHQVNIEHLARIVFPGKQDKGTLAYPDTIVGTDSHTTMVNGLGVLGWGVGGIEAEAAMLGQPITMLLPQVIGFKLEGTLKDPATATDLILTIVQILRKKGVVGKFVEFFGEGLSSLSLSDRATIANMAPEFGATCGLFPIDNETLKYLKLTARDEKHIQLIKLYAKAQGLFWHNDCHIADYSEIITLNLNSIEPSIAGPKRPQDKISLKNSKLEFNNLMQEQKKDVNKEYKVNNKKYTIKNGDIVIAAITSCTNTSNPSVMLAAGLLAKNAVNAGISTKDWVKTSLAPGSQVVTDYLKKADLLTSLEKLGFNLVGYGCTTCIGNSGPLSDSLTKTITKENLSVSAVLSGNRNFEGRIHPLVQNAYLASPPLVVAYAIAGTMNINFESEALGQNKDGKDIFLSDIWPSEDLIKSTIENCLTPDMFKKRYSAVFSGTDSWQKLETTSAELYGWQDNSTYIKKPPFFDNLSNKPTEITNINNANILVLLGDSVTTDHISPAGSITENSPAGKYLKSCNVNKLEFNSYGSRRGNHEVMLRGTFANIRLQNLITPDIKGSSTIYFPENKQMSIYDAAMKYKENNKNLIVIAGSEYGTGSSRDWAAKGTALLGVKAVIAVSFERIHRSNLIGMGVLPLQFLSKQDKDNLNLSGNETFDINLTNLKEASEINIVMNKNNTQKTFKAIVRIDTPKELEYYKNGGILHYVLRQLAKD